MPDPAPQLAVNQTIAPERSRSSSSTTSASSSGTPLLPRTQRLLTGPTASGATFIGFPGICYDAGRPPSWGAFLYPAGVYLGVLICMRLVSRAGNRLGTRSIPEFLGERYDSDAIRIAVSLYSLLLFFYPTGQLVSGLVMFEKMLRNLIGSQHEVGGESNCNTRNDADHQAQRG